MNRQRSRAQRFGAALLATTTAMLGLSTGLAAPAAYAAGGTLLFNEAFSGTEVLDSRAIGLNDACLTGASLGSTPPADASNLSDCEGHTTGSPNAGDLPGWLQLTDAANDRTGGMVFNRALPSSAGLAIEFDQAQYGGDGADGISFFLSDGSHELTQTGALGGSLGYGQGQNGTVPGVEGGYLGVGLDSYGNFLGDFGSLGAGCEVPSPFTSRVSNTVTLRGPGQGVEGYCLLETTATAPTGPSTLPGSLRVASPPTADAAVRNVRVTVSPGDFPTVTVEIDFSGTRTAYQTVLSYEMTDRAPATYKFGFSGSTGGSRDVHLIRNVMLSSVDSLGEISLIKQVDNTDPQPPAYGVGDTVPYQFVVTNTGDEPITDIEVTDPLIADIVCPEDTLGAAGGPDASMVCTGSLVVTGLQAQNETLLNTATVTALDSNGTSLTDSSEVTVPLEAPNPAMSLEKSASLNDANSNGLADAGETIDYSFLLTNTGNVALTDVSVDDPKAGPVTCDPTELAPGDAVTCTADDPYTVTEQDIIDGGVVNVATGNATTPPDVDPIDPPTDTETTPTPVAGAGLSIDKSATLNDSNSNGVADAGETIDYSFLLSNTGNVTLTDVSVDDPKAGSVTCDPTTLAPGASVTCVADSTYTVTEQDVIDGGVVNIATGNATTPPGVDPIEPPTDTETTPTPAAAAALALDKVATLNDTNDNGLADEGETIDYTFVLTNTGNVTLTDVSVDDPKAGSVTCDPTTLAPGAAVTCSADNPYTVTEQDIIDGGVINTATGNATAPPEVDPIIPPTDTETTPTPVAGPSLTIDKIASLNDTNSNGLADAGETIDYSFVLLNNGNIDLTDVSVDDPKAGPVTCDPTTLEPGESVTCTADNAYTVTEQDIIDGGVVNVATGNATTPPGVDPIAPPTDTETTPTPVASANLSIDKSASLNDTNSNGLADAGETIDYSFVLTNTGNVSLTDVSVDDPKAGPVTCNPTTLAPGESVTCATDSPYTVTETDIIEGGVVNVATGNATTPAEVEPIVPPTDTETTPTPPALGGLSLVKSDQLNDTNSNGLADAGETIDYSFVLTNTGNLTLTDVSVDDPMVGAVTCEATTLAPGQSVTCAADEPYTVTDEDVRSGKITNTATGAGTTPPGVDPIVPPTDTIVTPTGPVPPTPSPEPAPSPSPESAPGSPGDFLATTGADSLAFLVAAAALGLLGGAALLLRRRKHNASVITD